MCASLDVEFARRAQALGERLNADPPTSWRPDKPELEHPRVLVGVLVGQESSGPVGYDGRSTTIAVIRTPEQGDWAVWLWTSVLREEFETLSPQPGELVAIRYEGRVEARDGRPAYEKHSVIVDRDGVAVEWGAPGGETASPDAVEETVPEVRAPFSAAVDSTLAPAKVPARCEQCGHEAPDHAAGCPEELPF